MAAFSRDGGWWQWVLPFNPTLHSRPAGWRCQPINPPLYSRQTRSRNPATTLYPKAPPQGGGTALGAAGCGLDSAQGLIVRVDWGAA